MTRPVVEMSSGLRFRKFNGAHPRLAAHFRRARLEPETNKWGTIHDFSKADKMLPEPHYIVETEHDGKPWEVTHPSMKGKPVNPVGVNASRVGFVNTGLARSHSASSVLSPMSKKKPGDKKGFGGMALGRAFTFNC